MKRHMPHKVYSVLAKVRLVSHKLSQTLFYQVWEVRQKVLTKLAKHGKQRQAEEQARS